MTRQPITPAEFGAHLRSIKRRGFRLETRREYALEYERRDFDLFVAGHPRPPEQLDWWQPWLRQIQNLTAAGATISRVRITDNPPTDYQRWEIWATSVHERAGEHITYLDRAAAIAAGLPDYDFWLLDDGTGDERLLVLRHNDAGEPINRILITDPGEIARHGAWRDLAVSLAHPAEQSSAA